MKNKNRVIYAMVTPTGAKKSIIRGLDLYRYDFREASTSIGYNIIYRGYEMDEETERNVANCVFFRNSQNDGLSVIET